MKLTLFSLSLLLCLGLNANAQTESLTSKVVFFRTFNYFGGAVGFNIFANNSKITRMRSRTLEVVELAAKPTRISAKTEVERHIDLDLKSDHIYFIRGKAGIGIFFARPNLETYTASEFKALIDKKKFLQKRLLDQGFSSFDELINDFKTVDFPPIAHKK